MLSGVSCQFLSCDGSLHSIKCLARNFVGAPASLMRNMPKYILGIDFKLLPTSFSATFPFACNPSSFIVLGIIIYTPLTYIRHWLTLIIHCWHLLRRRSSLSKLNLCWMMISIQNSRRRLWPTLRLVVLLRERVVYVKYAGGIRSGRKANVVELGLSIFIACILDRYCFWQPMTRIIKVIFQLLKNDCFERLSGNGGLINGR